MRPTPTRGRARMPLRSAKIAVHGQDGENVRSQGRRACARPQHSAPSAISATMQDVMRDGRTEESVISHEMQFAVECCRQNFVGNEGALAGKPGADLDWPRFLALVRFHRVQGLVSGALDDGGPAPAGILDELSSDARAI